MVKSPENLCVWPTLRRWADGVSLWRNSPSWDRTAFGFLVIPLVVVSCAAVPETRTSSGTSQRSSESSPNSPAYYHFMQGYLAELAGDHAKAIQEYQEGLTYDTHSPFLRSRLATLYFSAGKMTAALEIIQHINPSEVQDSAILLQLAKIYGGAGQPEQALTFYDRAIELDDQSAKSYLSKGVLLLSLKRFDEAKDVFERGTQLAPDSHGGFYYLGKTLEQLGRPEEAEKHLIHAIELAPRFEPSYQALATLYERQEKNPEAIEVYERYLSTVQPHHKNFHQQVIRLLLRQGLYEQALDALRQLVADDPQDLNAQVRIALIYGEMGNPTQAIEELHAIVQAHPSELRIRDYLGLMYEEVKDFDHAIQVYQANLEREPTFYDSQLHLGYALYRLKRLDEAIPHLNQAVILNPGTPDSHLLLGLAYLQSEQHQLAMTTFEEGIQLHPNNSDLRFNLGAAYDKLDRFPDVVREMETVLNLDPNHADALNYLGYSYADRGIHIEEAVVLTKRAVALKPKNGYYIDSLGWALFKIGRIEEALTEIQRAAVLVKDDPVIFEHLGEIFLAQDKLERAREAWMRSLELDPSNHKLIEKFKQHGFGEPPPEKKPPAGLQPKVSHYAPDPQRVP